MATDSADPINARLYKSRMAGLAALKDATWIAQQEARTPAERIEAGAALRTWAHEARPDLARDPDWLRARQEDLESHARVAALMRRADDRLTR